MLNKASNFDHKYDISFSPTQYFKTHLSIVFLTTQTFKEQNQIVFEIPQFNRLIVLNSNRLWKNIERTTNNFQLYENNCAR